MTTKLSDLNPDYSKEDFKAEIRAAIEKGDTEKFSEVFASYLRTIEETIVAEAQGNVVINDSNILATRGVRQLTSEEEKFYQKTIEAMQSVNPADSLENLDVVMPETVVDSVFEDLKQDHELLSVIDFKNVTGLTKILLNVNPKQMAHWGPLTSKIEKELESAFKVITLGQNKLSAYMFVSQDMLDLGPRYLDRYVREVMYEAISIGLEFGIIKGTGKEMPIGMTRDIGDEAAVVGGEYPEKKAIKVNSLDPIDYGQLLAKLSETEKGNSRIVKNVILVVNPTDYFNKIMPATTIRALDGTYKNNILPYPTKIIQSTEMDEGKAVIGLSDKYFMGMGLVKNGKIEHSDHYKFLEDFRAYKVRFLGHGQAKGNTDFFVLDISDLKPAVHKVKVEEDIPTA